MARRVVLVWLCVAEWLNLVWVELYSCAPPRLRRADLGDCHHHRRIESTGLPIED